MHSNYRKLEKNLDFRFKTEWEEDHQVEVQAQAGVSQVAPPRLHHARHPPLHMRQLHHQHRHNLVDSWEVRDFIRVSLYRAL
jgi:hypothetical protein